jgi:kynureninase
MHSRNSHFLPGLRGWYGNSRKSQFLMLPQYEPEIDARKFQISNFDPGQVARVEAGLDLFHKAGGIHSVRGRNVRLTEYLLDQI